jgi:aspartate/methionine/tyrosine aminotransferase
LAQNKEVLNFTLGGISKTLGLPQMKLAWIAMNGPEALLKDACQRLEIIQDTYLSVNTPAQNTLAFWFSKKEIIQNEIKARIKENWDVLKNVGVGLKPAPTLQCLEPEGGWYGILKIPKTQSEEEWVIQFLEEDRTLVHPGYFFDFEEEAYLVISLMTEPNSFQEGIVRILKRLVPLPNVRTSD